ncbi:MAG TPA: DUF1573 domain-containing protein [Bacteroidales bacterium]|nr:DUF1573 domain-containing protein [Bacteroidales bacterium]HPJ54826.1 DUF1573 domain-containing protein [Bacteroidales bacterium]HPQ55864.1 DUF1573 domain-containing protein [Bacteroidales bacterium]
MKLLFVFFASVLFLGPALQQEDNQVVFDKTVHDFGDFRIDDGPKSHTFIMTNNGNKPVVIQTVISSCGCTVPEWTKEPILPGQKGSVTVTFSNDQGPYPFDKMLSVYVTGSSKPYVLRVRGVVHRKKFTLEDTHPVVMGPVRLRKKDLEMGQIRQGTVKTDSVEIINTGKYPVFLEFSCSHPNLTVTAKPSRLNSGEKGVLIYAIDSGKREEWGNVLYTAHLIINDKQDPMHVLTVKGSIKLDTSGMSRAEKAKAPVPQANQSAFEFKDTKTGSQIVASFQLSNKGKTPLVIYKTDTSHPGIQVKMAREIAPGAEVPVQITIPASETKSPGEVIYTVSLTTNAPSRPTVNLLVYGNLNP